MVIYSGFTYWKWWFSIVFCRFTRGYPGFLQVSPGASSRKWQDWLQKVGYAGLPPMWLVWWWQLSSKSCQGPCFAFPLIPMSLQESFHVSFRIGLDTLALSTSINHDSMCPCLAHLNWRRHVVNCFWTSCWVYNTCFLMTSCFLMRFYQTLEYTKRNDIGKMEKTCTA